MPSGAATLAANQAAIASREGVEAAFQIVYCGNLLSCLQGRAAGMSSVFRPGRLASCRFHVAMASSLRQGTPRGRRGAGLYRSTSSGGSAS